jgi:hypothetical protein
MCSLDDSYGAVAPPQTQSMRLPTESLHPMVGGGAGYGIFHPAVPPQMRAHLLAQKNYKLTTMGANRPVSIVSAVDAQASEEAGSRLHLMIVTLDYKDETGPEGYDCKPSDLSCSFDAIRVAELGRRCGCADVVALVDVRQAVLDEKAASIGVSSVPITAHPSTVELKTEFAAMGARCQEGDTFLFYFSGHGSYYTTDRRWDPEVDPAQPPATPRTSTVARVP